MNYSLFQRPRSSYWWAKFPSVDREGKVVKYHRKSTKRTSKTEAHKVAQALVKHEADYGQLGVRAELTMGEAAQRYIAQLENPQGYHFLFAERIKSSDSRVTKDSSMYMLDRNLLNDLKSQRSVQGLSNSYINTEVAFWITVYNIAQKDFGAAINNSTDLKGLALKTTQKTRYLMDGEETRLLDELNPQRDVYKQPHWTKRLGTDRQEMLQNQYDLAVFLLDTGARYMEVAQIPWSAVDYANWKTVNLYRTKVGKEGNLDMTSRLKAILQRRHAKYGNHPYVFPSWKHEKEPMVGDRKSLRDAIKRADLNTPSMVKRYGKFTPHSLRHTFASRLIQGGMSLYGVSKLLGHGNTKMTERYAHLSPSKLAEEAVSILEKTHDL